MSTKDKRSQYPKLILILVGGFMASAERTSTWVDTVETSLSASLLLGRESAREIAKAHLSELFKLVDADYDAAFEEVRKIRNFGSRRLLFECFRYSFSMKVEKSEFAILLRKIDFNDKKLTHEYDQALIALLRESEGDVGSVLKRVKRYPISKKIQLEKRLDNDAFQRSRRIQFNQNSLFSFSQKNYSEFKIRWWHWLVLILALLLVFSELVS